MKTFVRLILTTKVAPIYGQRSLDAVCWIEYTMAPGDYMQPSNEALVQACRAGDATAWETLVDRYQRLVYSIARHSGLDAEQSADVFQRVFDLLVEALPRIERPALIGAWLATTARHEAWRV